MESDFNFPCRTLYISSVIFTAVNVQIVVFWVVKPLVGPSGKLLLALASTAMFFPCLAGLKITFFSPKALGVV